MSINYSEKIPNNVNLSEDRTLQRALEQWQPNYLNWWNDMGPDGSQNFDVYLRTAVSIDPQGWAQFGHVKMPDYRWGIFLNPAEQVRKIHFGDHLGDDAWQEVPGEYRANLRRIIVTQGDTEPASVEQQRHLGLTAPSQYDLRNLFQVNVEEGRHLWAMVYLLHKYFGRDGREEGEALLERRSGQTDNPRILQAFNEQTPDWLSFFMFTYFTEDLNEEFAGAINYCRLGSKPSNAIHITNNANNLDDLVDISNGFNSSECIKCTHFGEFLRFFNCDLVADLASRWHRAINKR